MSNQPTRSMCHDTFPFSEVTWPMLISYFDYATFYNRDDTSLTLITIIHIVLAWLVESYNIRANPIDYYHRDTIDTTRYKFS